MFSLELRDAAGVPPRWTSFCLLKVGIRLHRGEVKGPRCSLKVKFVHVWRRGGCG